MDDEPDIDLPFQSPGSMSDDQLWRAERDFSLVSGRLSAIAGRCSVHARAIRAIIDRRDARRRRGEVVEPSKPKRSAIEADADIETGETPTFTDHAILRWLERLHGVDLTAVQEEMARSYARGTTMAGGGIVTADGQCFVRSAEGKVKTVIPLDWLREDDVQVARATYERGLARRESRDGPGSSDAEGSLAASTGNITNER